MRTKVAQWMSQLICLLDDQGIRVWFPEGQKIVIRVQTEFGLAQVPVPWVIRSLSLDIKCITWGMNLTTALHLVARLVMPRVLPPLPHASSWQSYLSVGNFSLLCVLCVACVRARVCVRVCARARFFFFFLYFCRYNMSQKYVLNIPTEMLYFEEHSLTVSN
jgi:hypothetical protein